MEISFFHIEGPQYGWEQYHTRGLGGTESAILNQLEALHLAGVKVRLISDLFISSKHDQWEVLSLKEAPKIIEHPVVVVRGNNWLLTQTDFTFNQGVYTWIHDDEAQGLAALLDAGIVKKYIVNSLFHKKRIADTLENKQQTTRSIVMSAGVKYVDFSKVDDVDKKNYVLHTSVPGRGLENLFKIWTKVSKELPHAQLLITSSLMIYGVSETKNQELYQRYYRQLAELDNVKLLYNIPKEELIKLYQFARITIFPTAFKENCCIAALEAMAAKNAIIASDLGALSERVEHRKNGYLVNSEPGSKEFIESFATHICTILTNRKLNQEMGEYSRKLSRAHDYKLLVNQWKKL